MFVTTHVVSGAIIGRLLNDHAALAAVAGVASHFALDALPHWAPGEGLPFLPAAVVDGLLASLLTGIVANYQSHRPAILAGMLGAALPDMDKPCTLFFGRSPFPVWVDEFHSSIQRESSGALGREVVIALTGTVAVITALVVRRQPEPNLCGLALVRDLIL